MFFLENNWDDLEQYIFHEFKMSAMIMEAETSTAFHTNVTLLDKFRLGIEIINDSCNLGLLVGRGCWETCFFIRGQIAKSGTDKSGERGAQE